MVTLTNLGIGLCQIRFVQRWTHFENCCHLCPKSGFNLVTRLPFTSIIQCTNVIVGLELLTNMGLFDLKTGLAQNKCLDKHGTTK